jgi:hypothetical protein
MKKLTLCALIAFASMLSVDAQDKTARKLADRMAASFSNGLRPLDNRHLLRGRLSVSIQNWIAEPEFESRTFKSFTAMERWLKKEENQPGFPIRTSGENVSCRKGLCRLDLVDNQMAHNHVYLTHVWYGYQKGRIYVKRVRILYG